MRRVRQRPRRSSADAAARFTVPGSGSRFSVPGSRFRLQVPVAGGPWFTFMARSVSIVSTGKARDLDNRLWRLRRRGDSIDATLDRTRDRWRLTFTRKGRQLAYWEFETRSQAIDVARAQLCELERAGWTEHW